MKLLLPLFLVFAFIAGCGSDRSGSSSSGSGGSGGSGGGTGTQVNFATLAGDYAGNASVRVSTLLASDTINSRVTATIDSRGRIEITFDDDAVATGQLARDGTFRISDTLANAGIDGCSGTVTIAGRVEGSTIRATISSSGASCSGISASADGTLTATRR